MVTWTNNAGSGIWDGRGLSTDTKPTDGIPNGSTFYVMDAKELGLDTTLYMYDADAKKWWKQ